MSETKKHNLTVQTLQVGQRLDHFLVDALSGQSRSLIQKLLKEGQVLVNDAPCKPALRLNLDDRIEVSLPPPAPTGIEPEDIRLDIVYEDSDVVVINKPPGLVVHPGAGVQRGTLVNALMNHCQDLSGVGGRMRPGIVHRLDKDTSGLMVVAKNDPAHIGLQQQFAEKSAGRIYYCLVWGNPDPAEGTIKGMLNRSKSDRKKFTVADTGKPAVTHYLTEEPFSFLSLLRIKLETGRTHQIRVHLKSVHHPVFGDAQYNGRQSQLNRLSSLSERNYAVYLLKMIDRQALHAGELTFVHPLKKESMTFRVPLAPDLKAVIEELRQHEEAQ